MTSREIENKHEPDVVDRIRALTFQTARVEVYAAGVIADGFLSKLSINRKFRTLALPVNVGARRDEIIAALGKPDDLPDNVFEYREEVSYANRSLETVRLHLTVIALGQSNGSTGSSEPNYGIYPTAFGRG